MPEKGSKIQEGTERKGGVRQRPSTPRPKPPKPAKSDRKK